MDWCVVGSAGVFSYVFLHGMCLRIGVLYGAGMEVPKEQALLEGIFCIAWRWMWYSSRPRDFGDAKTYFAPFQICLMLKEET
jgi:hypothetical protein